MHVGNSCTCMYANISFEINKAPLNCANLFKMAYKAKFSANSVSKGKLNLQILYKICFANNVGGINKYSVRHLKSARELQRVRISLISLPLFGANKNGLHIFYI